MTIHVCVSLLLGCEFFSNACQRLGQTPPNTWPSPTNRLGLPTWMWVLVLGSPEADCRMLLKERARGGWWEQGCCPGLGVGERRGSQAKPYRGKEASTSSQSSAGAEGLPQTRPNVRKGAGLSQLFRGGLGATSLSERRKSHRCCWGKPGRVRGAHIFAKASTHDVGKESPFAQAARCPTQIHSRHTWIPLGGAC